MFGDPMTNRRAGPIDCGADCTEFTCFHWPDGPKLDQVRPFHFARLLAGTPPAAVKAPAATKAGPSPSPSSWIVNDRMMVAPPLNPPPTLDHVESFHRAKPAVPGAPP